MIKIFVIANNLHDIDSIKSTINTKGDEIEVSGWATSTNEALPKLKESNAKVVILDIIMPELAGIELCWVIKDMYPDNKVIALIGELDSLLVYNTWMNRADAILMTERIKEEIVDTVHDVMAGLKILGSKVPEFYEELKELGKNSGVYNGSGFPLRCKSKNCS